MTWVNSKFKKKIEVKSGYTWSGDQELYENREGSTAVLRVSNIQETLELDDILYLINVSEQHKIDKKISKNWTIAVNSNGNRNRVGKGIFIEEDMEFLFASFLVAFKPFDENEIDPRYFYYWYSSETVQKRISAIAEGTTGLSNLELRYLKSQDIYHPASIIEQRYIANTINAVDKTIQATKNSIAKLEKLKTSLMQNLLTGKMKPDGSWRTEDEFQITKRGIIPKDWKYQKINKISTTYSGATPSRSNEKFYYGEIPWVKSGEVNQSFIYDTEEKISLEAFNSSSTKWVEAETILFAMYGATAGQLAILKVKACTNQAVLAIPINEPTQYYRDYVLFAIEVIVPYLITVCQGSGQPNLSKTIIDKSYIAVPNDIEEQKEIAKHILSVLETIYSKEIKIKKLINLKKSLMQNLLTGKVRIPQEALKQ